MIVKMKKVHIIVRKKDARGVLLKLRDLGVVHIEHQASGMSENLGRVKREMSLLERSLSILRSKVSKKQGVRQKKVSNWPGKSKEIIDKNEFVVSLHEGVTKKNVFINLWDDWGNFSLADIEMLKQKNIYVALCEVSQKELSEISDDIIVEVIDKSASRLKCILFSDKEIIVPFKLLDLPAQELNTVIREKKRDEKRIKDINSKLSRYTCFIESFEKKLASKKDELKFEMISADMDKDEELSWLAGFCPDSACEELEDIARSETWGFDFEDAVEEDQAPTLLKNPKWVDTIEPVFNLINVIPGYSEIDVSMSFLLFLSFFVGILVGDAGYGLLGLGLAGGLHFSKKPKSDQLAPYVLVYVMSACALVWGVLTGVYFGQQWISSILPPMIPWLNDSSNIQLFCFVVGAGHLSLAHIMRGIKKYPSISFLSDVGWVLIIWFMFFWARFFVLNASLPVFTMKILGVLGAALVLLFTNPNKNPFKAVQSVLLNFPLDAIAAFTDVISYIRLYAVGLATVALADAANSMNVLGMVPLHLINIVLALLAILVHGIRLNILEFSGHLGMEWTGRKYEPFKKNK